VCVTNHGVSGVQCVRLLACEYAGVERETLHGNGEVQREPIRNRPGAAVKSERGGLDQGSNGWQMDRVCLSLGHVINQEYMQGIKTT
jgi:hypothetical protein